MSSPRLSVVLVVLGEQAYLRECVLSVLAQSFRDVEVIAVAGAAHDHARDVLDELAEQDERLVLRRLDEPIGSGEAWNLALDAAAGDFVWFAVPTDRVPPGAAAAVATRLDETEPDVLAVQEARVAALAAAAVGPLSGLLGKGAPGEGFTLEERPAAAQLGLEVRGRIFRTAFLRDCGLRFAPGGYGHLPLTLPALVAAERIDVLPGVCYVRLDPPGAAADAPFDVFGQYDAALRLAGGRGPLLAPVMLRHYLSLYVALPSSERAEFFARMSASYRRHAGDELPGVRARLVARGRHRSFRALGWGHATRAAARRRVRGVGRLARRIVRGGRRLALRSYYRLQLRAPLDPDLAVFAAYWYRGYACNPRAVHEKLAELVPRVRGVWVVAAEHAAAMPPGIDYVIAGTRAYYRLIARATYLVNNVNFPNELVKRQGTVHLQTHHGTPVKTMGLDLRDAFVAGSRLDFEALLRRAARWDYSISANAFSTRAWERAYPARYESLEVGYPRNDALVNATEADVERIRAELGIEPGRRAVLFAPTHREYLHRYVPTADLARLADEVGPEFVIMARVHYFYDDDPEFAGQAPARRILDVSAHPSVEELCLAADVLVTDYSSLLFDYAVLDRPIVVHAPDWDVYRDLRGTYFDLLAEPPGVVTRSDDELLDAFRSGAVDGEGAARLRAAFRERFCSLEDGRASERVVRRVWLGEANRTEQPADSAADVKVQVEA